MKYKILGLLGILCLTSCVKQGDRPVIAAIGDRNIEVYIVDNCEYIGWLKGYHSDFLTHKGNCKFCKERRLNDK